MSDGLFAPVNAPFGGQSSLGVQAGTQGAPIITQLVIVFGPGPAIYVYSGTPAFGNLVGSWVSVAGTDPFGNPTQKDLTVYVANGGYVNINSSGGSGGNTAVLLHPGSTTHVTLNPQVIGASNNSGAANEFEILALTSGTAGGLDDAQLQLLSERADASVGAVMNFLIGGTVLSQLFKTVWNIGVPISCTLGTAANPTLITTDSWHLLTLDTGWSTLGGQTAPQYRLNADHTVEMIGAAQFTSAITAQNICSGLNVLPAAYRPTNQQFIGSPPGSAGLQVSSNGNLLASASTATAFCNFNGSIKLGI